MINVFCPSCGVSMQVEEKYIGKRGRCNKCKQVFTVPERADFAATAEPKAEPITPAAPARGPDNPFANTPSPRAVAPTSGTESPAGMGSGDLPFGLSVGSDPAWGGANPFPLPENPFAGGAAGYTDAGSPLPYEVAPFGENPFDGDLGITPAPPAGATPFVEPPADPSNPFALPFTTAGPPAAEPAATVRPAPGKTPKKPAREPELARPEPRREPATEPPPVPISRPTRPAPNPPPIAPPPVRERGEAEVAAKLKPAATAPVPKPSQEPPREPPIVENAPAVAPVSAAPSPTVERSIATIPAGTIPSVANVRVASVETFALTLPAAPSATEASQPAFLVKIVGSNGRSGWGEVPLSRATPQATRELAHLVRSEFVPVVVGLPVWKAEPSLRAYCQRSANSGLPLHGLAVGLELALHDLLAQTLELPLFGLFGGQQAHSVQLTWPIRASRAEDAIELVRQGINEGYSAFLLHLGANDSATDRAVIEAVAGALERGMSLLIDAHHGYRLDEALRLVRVLGSLGVRALANPVPSTHVSGLRRLVGLGLVPIGVETGGGAASILELVHAEAVDVPIMKLGSCGGLRAATHCAAVAEAAGMTLWGMQGAGAGLELAAALHFFAGQAPGLPLGLETAWKGQNEFVKSHFVVKGGFAVIPQVPGIGATVDEERLQPFVAEI